MDRIVIADVKSSVCGDSFRGHGRAVAEHYLNALRGLSDICVAGGPIYGSCFQKTILLPYNSDASHSPLRKKWRVMCNLFSLFRICRKDTIIIQSCAVVTAFVGIALFKAKETRVFMIQYDRDGVGSCFKRFLFGWAKRKIDGIICPNEEVGLAYGLPYCVVPDYIYAGDISQKMEIPYAQRQYDFCMLGLIWRSKGFVEAARLLAGTPYKVLIAGMPSHEEGLREELAEICASAENIELHMRYLEAEEYDAYIRQSRYCILNYSECYSQKSSGVVFDFLFRGVPVIGRNCRALQFIAENGIGRTYDDLNSFHPSEVLREEIHQQFLKSLQIYYQKHFEYRKRLLSFIS